MYFDAHDPCASGRSLCPHDLNPPFWMFVDLPLPCLCPGWTRLDPANGFPELAEPSSHLGGYVVDGSSIRLSLSPPQDLPLGPSTTTTGHSTTQPRSHYHLRLKTCRGRCRGASCPRCRCPLKLGLSIPFLFASSSSRQAPSLREIARRICHPVRASRNNKNARHDNGPEAGRGQVGCKPGTAPLSSYHFYTC